MGTDPEEGATVTADLDEVSVTFNDVLLDMGGQSTVVDVTGPDGGHYATACPQISGAEVSAPVELGGPGEYTVDWRVVSADGHPVSGELTFEYAPPSGTDQAPGAVDPACGATGDGQDGAGAPAGTAGPGEAEAAPSAGVVVAVALGAALLGGVVVLVVVRAGRRSRDDEDPGVSSP
ncbi:copper resistance protein CopC [Isoptericola sp. S6320L]|uniref:copper resistance CopC family protein n=1 Tax=Isoptericola sp. S6320L TaxID=2926411 RepID=UPI0027E24D2C|nr:copper resistance protein CopC [Isoptericola sp. S6320L]